MSIPIQHQHTAHCETGCMSTLLRHQGLDVSEAMALGLASGIAFAFLPFVKIGGLPLIAYRMPPNAIIKGLKKRLHLDLNIQTFSSGKQGMEALDKQLDSGKLVGLQTSVFWLPYFPNDMRFHFNAHNLIVYGKEGHEYLISDPVFETTMTCDAKDLQKARFAKGAMAPKGKMYYINSKPEPINYSSIIHKAVRSSIRAQTPPVPIIGNKGIHYLARKIERLPKEMKSTKRQFLFLGHIIRMQEEIGTGGAGFRYIYASFLQEAAKQTGTSIFDEASKMMTEVGDEWRNFALHAAKMCKGRSTYDAKQLSDLLHHCADQETKVWAHLKQA